MRSRTRVKWSQTAGFVLLAAIAWGVVVGAWALATPHGAVEGVERTLVGIWCVEEDFARCTPPLQSGSSSEVSQLRLVPQRILQQACVRKEPDRSAACLTEGASLVGRQVEVDLGNGQGPAGVLQTGSGNPPLYLRVNATLVSEDVDASIASMRQLNAALAIVLPILALLLAVPRARVAMVATGIILAPSGLLLIGSVDSSSWAIVGALVTWPMLVTLASPVRSGRRLAAGSLATVGAGLLVTPVAVRPMSTGFFLVIAVLVATGAWTNQRERGWWTVQRVSLALILGALASTLTRTALPSPLITHVVPLRDLPGRMMEAPVALGGLFGRSVGLAPEMIGVPTWVTIGLVSAVVMVLLGGFLVQSGSGRFVAVLIAVLAAAHLVYVSAMSGYEGFALRDPMFSAHHFLPAVLMTVAAFTLLPSRASRLLSPGLAAVVAALFTVVHGAALRHQIARFTHPLEGRTGLLVGPEWWWDIPLSPEAVWVAGATAMAVLAFLSARLVAGHHGPEQPSPSDAREMAS